MSDWFPDSLPEFIFLIGSLMVVAGAIMDGKREEKESKRWRTGISLADKKPIHSELEKLEFRIEDLENRFWPAPQKLYQVLS